MSYDDRADFIRALRATHTIPSVGPEGLLPLPEILGTRSWFDERLRHFRSSGGRPTDPRWEIKRSIPFACATWTRLTELASVLSEADAKVGPGQIAACLLEEAIRVVVSADNPAERVGAKASHLDLAPARGDADDLYDLTDPSLRDWQMPELFAGSRN